MDTKTLIAIGLMVVIYFFFFSPQPRDIKETKPTTETTQSVELTAPTETAANELDAGATQFEDQSLNLENELIQLSLRPDGSILQVSLKKYFKEPEGEELVSWNFNEILGLNKQNVFIGSKLLQWQSYKQSENEILLSSKLGEIEAQRRIRLLPDAYIIEVDDELKNSGERSVEVSENILLERIFEPESQPSFWKRVFAPQTDYKQAVWFQDGSLEHEMLGSIPSEAVYSGDISWAGYASKYFFFGAIAEHSSSLKLEQIDKNQVRQKFQLSTKQVPPNESRSFNVSYYIGPKEISKLEMAGANLDRSIDYGNWIGPISRLLLSILRFFHQAIPNYGIGIILLTILVKLLLFPLAYKSAVSMKKLQIVQPKMKEIRDKYKDNPQRMNAEMMALYRTEKVNPVGGCLPLLLQMPVFFALYRVFYASIEMRHEEFFGWIQDLSTYDPLFVTPVLMTVLMYFQQKLTPMPTAGGEENEAVKIQKAMFKWMPFIFGGIMLFLPAGLTLYFLVNALLSVAQQLYLNKKLSHLQPKPLNKGLQAANGSS